MSNTVPITFDAKLDGIISKLGNLESIAKSIGGKMGGNLGAGIAGGMAAAGTMIVAKLAEMGIQAGIAMGKAVAQGLKDSVMMAGDAQESISRFNALFKDQAAAAEAWADSLAESVGRSSLAIKEGMSSFQAFFIGLGFGGKEARQMSQQLQELSLDFASFNNLSDEESMERFISALSGSSEVMDKFGVNIKEAALAQKGITESSTEAEKAVARLNIIMEAMGAQGAIGDATKTAGSFNNQMKRVTAQIDTIYVEIGQKLVPILESMGDGIFFVVGELGDMAKAAVDAGIALTEGLGGDAVNDNSEALVVVFARLTAGVKRMAAELKVLWVQTKQWADLMLKIGKASGGVMGLLLPDGWDSNELDKELFNAREDRDAVETGDAAADRTLAEFRAKRGKKPRTSSAGASPGPPAGVAAAAASEEASKEKEQRKAKGGGSDFYQEWLKANGRTSPTSSMPQGSHPAWQAMRGNNPAADLYARSSAQFRNIQNRGQGAQVADGGTEKETAKNTKKTADKLGEWIDRGSPVTTTTGARFA
jgi:hypothetical protein